MKVIMINKLLITGDDHNRVLAVNSFKWCCSKGYKSFQRTFVIRLYLVRFHWSSSADARCNQFRS
jgi:hypothetical protein